MGRHAKWDKSPTEAEARRILNAGRMKERRAREKAEAAELLKNEVLTDQEITDLLRPTREQLEAFNALRTGRPTPGYKEALTGTGKKRDPLRHAAVIMQAMKISLEHTLPKPKDPAGADAQVKVVVQTLSGEEPKVEKFQAPAEATLTPKPEESN